MALVIRDNEIILNSVRFPTKNPVQNFLASTLPEKQVIGDYSKDSEPVLSSWVIDDQRGGLGVEEMDETKQAKNFWWATNDTRFPGHETLPKLATAVTLPFTPLTVTDGGLETWTTTTDLTSWTETLGSAGTVTRDSDNEHGGTYSAKLATTGGGDYAEISQVLTGWNTGLRGKAVTVRVWSKGDGGVETVQGFIDDGVGTTTAAINKTATWTENIITRTLDAAATGVTVRFRHTSAESAAHLAYIDDVSVYPHSNAPVNMCNFNSDLYIGMSSALFKIENDTGVISHLQNFTTDITCLVATVGTNMAVGLGDGTNFWYVTSADVITETNVSACYRGIHWDNKFCKIDSTGTFSYTATLSATPSFTANGTITGETVKNLAVYVDATGNDIIYCVTTTGLWAHDYTNALFYQTKVRFAQHPNAGLGLISWNDSLYASMGLHVKRYTAGSLATVEPVGLDQNDGIPAEYNGEIANFIGDNDYIYAVVDSTQAGATTYSWLARYNGTAWTCLWATGTINQAMHGGVVSSAYARRLWFDCADALYYLSMERNLTSPKKITSYPYATAGIKVTPWFDAGWAASDKIAVRMKIFVADATATETAVVKYRINHATTALATTWTTLSTITSAGETEVTFGSGAGIAFKNIQFRIEEAGGSTLSPDVQYAVFYFLKAPKIVWGWRVNVDCSKPYPEGATGSKSPSQLVDAIKTVTELTTLAEFSFRNDTGGTETVKVSVRDVNGGVNTGKDKRGEYSLLLVAP